MTVQEIRRRVEQTLVLSSLEEPDRRRLTNSDSTNGDKLSTLHYLFSLSQQHSMFWVGTGLMPSNSKAAQRNDINYVAAVSAAMAQSRSDSSPDEMPPVDFETAKLFGPRIAEVAGKLSKFSK